MGTGLLSGINEDTLEDDSAGGSTDEDEAGVVEEVV